MSRPVRIEVENAFYHVMNRGRGRRAIFHDAEYFEAFLYTLEEANRRFRLEIHAYCLMSNHYHLLVKTPEANLGRAMRHVGGLYTQRYNRLKKTDGPLFRGRYKAILVDSDTYLLHLSQYIHRNPRIAGLVENLADHSWSSYPAYVGKSKPQSYLYREAVYAQLNVPRRQAYYYRKFMADDHLHPDIRDFYEKKRLAPILGDKKFKQRFSDHSENMHHEATREDIRQIADRPSIEAIVKAVANAFSVTEHEIYRVKKGRGSKNTPRKMAMYLAQNSGGYRLTDIAKAFGLTHYGGVSFAIRSIVLELREDKQLKTKLKSIINRFDP